MTTCKTCNKKCGSECGCEKGLTTAEICTNMLPVCPNPDPCTETFNAACVVWMGDEIPELDIKKGDRVDKILSRLMLIAVNPGCGLPSATCNAVIGLATTSISSSIINLKWLAAVGALSYVVEYREISSLTWLVNAPVTTLTDYISGLIASTEYYIRITTTCSAGTCYSLVIKVKTKAI